MRRGEKLGWTRVLLLAAFCAIVPSTAFAQASGIAGVVRDTSGAVLPGVTVEAASPALIEKARSVVTDSQGRYNIVDLRPGVYTVTFTITGFSPFVREGIELSAQFTATVNAEMRVGAIEETITVSGATPVVDTTNVVRRQVVDDETINAMPTSKNWSTIGVMTIGVFSNQNDVGGSAGEHQNQLKAHGGSFNDRLVQMDGLMISNMACNYSCTGVSTNDASTQELSYEIGAISAETGGGGVRVNIIPKEGGNVFSGSAFFNFANSGLQSDNLDENLIGQGVLSVDRLDTIYDSSFAFGGPLKRDKLWFWSAHRYWGYEIFRTGVFYEKNPFDFVYDADPDRPGTDSQWNTSNDLRLTWQISPRNKLSAYYNLAPRQTDHWIAANPKRPICSASITIISKPSLSNPRYRRGCSSTSASATCRKPGRASRLKTRRRRVTIRSRNRPPASTSGRTAARSRRISRASGRTADRRRTSPAHTHSSSASHWSRGPLARESGPATTRESPSAAACRFR
jgi:hypothetical protein